MSVALLLTNNLDNSSKGSLTFSAQLHLPARDLFWVNLRVQLHLPPLRSLDLLISPGTLTLESSTQKCQGTALLIWALTDLDCDFVFDPDVTRVSAKAIIGCLIGHELMMIQGLAVEAKRIPLLLQIDTAQIF